MPTLAPTRCTTFDRIVCAVDGSRSVTRGRPPGAHPSVGARDLELDAVFGPPAVAYSPYGSPLIVSEREVSRCHSSPRRSPSARTLPRHLLHGPTVRRLLPATERVQRNACRRRAQATETAAWASSAGSVTTAMLHRAKASVLVARAPVARRLSRTRSSSATTDLQAPIGRSRSGSTLPTGTTLTCACLSPEQPRRTTSTRSQTSPSSGTRGTRRRRSAPSHTRQTS